MSEPVNAVQVGVAAAPSAALLEIRGLKKSYSGVCVLDGVDLRVEIGSVHALLGENGAGKSTLIKALSGLVTVDAGCFLIDGVAQAITSVRQAEALGLRFIHQELNLVPGFDVVENCFVGRPYPRSGLFTYPRSGLCTYPRSGLFIDRAAMRRQAEKTARLIAPELPLRVPTRRLSTGQRQLAVIIRALVNENTAGENTAGAGARLIVMDEPTASLSDGESHTLHRAVRALAAQGVAVIFISHRLDEVLALCDHYTVLRNGKLAGSGTMADTSRERLVSLMTGSKRLPQQARVAAAPSAPPAQPASPAPVLEVIDLPFGAEPGNPGTPAHISLTVRAGEILGLYGLIGAGRSSLLGQIWGAQRHGGGRIVIDRQDMGNATIAQRIHAGSAYVPEDRRGQGLIASRNIAENLALPDLPAVRGHPWLPLTSARRLLKRAAGIRAQLSIKMASSHARPLTLSGGNQQKLLFGRWSSDRPLRLLLLDEPSRGVDVGAKGEIHALVRHLAANGAAVLMATSDMDELLALSHRVIVMAGGRVTAELSGAAREPHRIVAAAFAHAHAHAHADRLHEGETKNATPEDAKPEDAPS